MSKDSGTIQLKQVSFRHKRLPDILIVKAGCSMCDKAEVFIEQDENSVESFMMASGWSGELGMLMCPKCDKTYSARNSWRNYRWEDEYYDI